MRPLRLRRPYRLTALSLGLALMAGPSLGQTASPVSVQVRAPGNKPVAARLSVRQSGVQRPITIDTDMQGNRIIPDLPCDATVEVRARPISGRYSGTGQWAACNASPLVIAVRQNQITLAAGDALDFDYPAAMAERRASLQAALDLGDRALAASSAEQLASYLQSNGEERLADSLKSIAADQRYMALADLGADVPDVPMTYNLLRRDYVAKNATLDALSEFQAEHARDGALVKDRQAWRSLERGDALDRELQKVLEGAKAF